MTSPVPKQILDQHVAILGKTRSGKSSVMRGLVEGLLERGQPVCIIDPKGDWYGLKLAADGKRPGYPVVIFSGEHADIPINEHAGAHVAELVATGNRPSLIDLGGWMPGPRTQFWIDFASTLFRHTKGQRWLAIDEVHNFAPKGKVLDPQAGKALHWANRLASEGLGKGLAMIFASQRPQKVHNDTLTSAETLIAMRVLHPSDRGAISDWIRGVGNADGDEVLASLAQMERGEGWVWSPEIGFGPKRVKFPMFSTYDSFRPQSVEDTKRLKGWASVDLDDVRAKMATVIEQAKASDPRELHRQIAVLKAELAKVPAAAPAVVKAVAPVLTDADRRLISTLTDKITEIGAAISKDLDIDVRPVKAAIEAAFDGFLAKRLQVQSDFLKALDGKRLEAIRQKVSAAVLDRVQRPQLTIQRLPSIQPPAPAGGSGDSTLKTMHRAMLTALAQHPGGLTKRKILIHTGYASSGPVSSAFADLVRDGLVAPAGAGLAITGRGVDALGSFEPLPTGDALLQHLLTSGKLSTMEAKLLSAVCTFYPEAVRKGDVLDLAQYASSGPVSSAFAKLVGLGYLESHGPSMVKAAKELFS